MMVNILYLEVIAMKMIDSIALFGAQCISSTNVHRYIRYESRNRKQTNDLCCKKAFQTNGIEKSITVLNVTIFCGPTVLKVSFSDCKLC